MTLDRLRSAAAATLDLVLPGDCAACGGSGGPACRECAAPLDGSAAPAWPAPSPPGLPEPWAVAAYDGAVRALILAHKEHGARSLAAPLGRALATAVHAGTARPAHDARPLLLVPMPSRPAALRARGNDPTLAMARAAAAALRGNGRRAVVRPVLRMSRQAVDQAGLDANARAANLRGSVLLASRLVPVISSGRVVLVDDVITTGASLAAAATALSSAGVVVAAAAVVAATRRRTPS